MEKREEGGQSTVGLVGGGFFLLGGSVLKEETDEERFDGPLELVA